VARICHTRPDICCGISLAAQVTTSSFNASAFKQLNLIIQYLQASKNIYLRYPKLDIESLQVVVYSDSSFANRLDKSSQLGFVVLLADASGKCAILQLKSHKSRRVVRSSTAGETLAFSEAFDASFILRCDLSKILNRHIPLLMLTDSESLFKTLTKARYTTERRLLVDISAARQAYHAKDISIIGLIASRFNAADGMTKI
jgi:uncharacterized protein YjgD (DUF1641 family)